MPGIASRLVAVTLLLAVIIGGWLLAAASLDWFDEKQSALLRDKALLERYHQTIATEPILRQRLEAMAAQIREEGLYLPSEKAAQAGVRLQERIKKLIRAEDGQIRTVRSRTSKSDGDHDSVSVDVQAKLTPKGLLQIFRTLEGEMPLLLIDQVQLRGDQAADRLLVNFSVRGFVHESRS